MDGGRKGLVSDIYVRVPVPMWVPMGVVAAYWSAGFLAAEFLGKRSSVASLHGMVKGGFVALHHWDDGVVGGPRVPS